MELKYAGLYGGPGAGNIIPVEDFTPVFYFYEIPTSTESDWVDDLSATTEMPEKKRILYKLVDVCDLSYSTTKIGKYEYQE